MQRISAAAVVTLMLAGVAFAQTAEDAFGVWLNTVNKAHIEIYKCGDNLCGKLLKVADGQKTDSKNPDPTKRSQPIEGLVFMDGFTKTDANVWSGKSYNRLDGKSYPATLTVRSKDALDLKSCPQNRCVTFNLTPLSATPKAETRAEFCAFQHSVCTICAGLPATVTKATCLGTCKTRLADCQRTGCFHWNNPGPVCQKR
jgi:uncharacterized protein (DUF2147 family)